MFFTFMGGVVGFVLLVVLSALFNGYVLSVLWGWFMVPTLGLPALSIVQAIGIAIVVNFLTYQDMSGIPKKEQSFGKTLAQATLNSISISSASLLMGWVAHQFM